MVHGPPALLLVLALLVTASSATAQNVVVDEGTFRILRDGRAIGTETFAIRRVGQGTEARVIANADIELELAEDTERIKPLLQAGSDLSLSAYQLEVSGREPLEIAVTSSDRRLLARTRSPAGEQEREFRATPGGVLLEQGVAHQYWFLSQLEEGTAVTVLVPRASAQDRIEVRSVHPETVTVAGAQVLARHVTFATNRAVHEVWYDADGRVLRVRVPETGFAAERTSR